MSIFKLENVSIGYNGRFVLNDITLNIEPGEKVALIGPSGAGKSTLLTTLYERSKEQAALVPQEFALVRNLSVFHNVFMGRLNQHSSLYNLINLIHPLQRELGAVRPILEALGLEDKAGAPIGELSGGQQQRTAVARAIFQGGEVVLADEPVSAVDPLQSREVLAALTEGFRTVVLAMHDVQLALEFSHRLIGLKDGGVLFDRPTGGMKASDLDDFFRL